MCHESLHLGILDIQDLLCVTTVGRGAVWCDACIQILSQDKRSPHGLELNM